MKNFNELVFKSDVRYTKTHEWAKKDEGVITVGIDDYSQSALGDIVYIELPDEGSEIQVGASFCSIEATKAVSDVYAPVSGKITEVNTMLADSPEIVNSDPFGAAWIVKIQPSKPDEFESLMEAEEYKEYVKALYH